jgi:hypothetical protein
MSEPVLACATGQPCVECDVLDDCDSADPGFGDPQDMRLEALEAEADTCDESRNSGT